MKRDSPGHKPHPPTLEDAGAQPSYCRGSTACPRWQAAGAAAGAPLRLRPPLPPAEDVFPCKDCGIWYRSERNLQAHLLYYCASRQGTSSPAVAAPDEKPKETYPNERVCPFPQCRKSCPSASSLEIHMRSHSGEPRPQQRVSPPKPCMLTALILGLHSCRGRAQVVLPPRRTASHRAPGHAARLRPAGWSAGGWAPAGVLGGRA